MSSTPPSVSVVVPSFNHQSYIEECLTSVLESAPPHLELLVVDDGSTDRSVELISSLAARDPRIRLETQENSGAHAALNRAIELSRGEIIFVLNSDDVYEPDRIQTFLRRFAADPTLSLLSSWVRVVDASGAELGIKQGFRNMPPWPRSGSGPGLSELGDLRLALLESNFVATTSNIAFRRELFSVHGARFLPLRYTHDWELILEATHHGHIAMVKEPLVRYRVHDTNTISEGDEQGRGDMRFEVMWTVARHSCRILRSCGADSRDGQDLHSRLWVSAPYFGCPALFAQLLLLRGNSNLVPALFGALSDPLHPFSRSAKRLLANPLS